MARMAVTSYLESAESIHGPEVADALWRRVQAGFILADSVRTTPAKFNESVIDPPDWTQGIEVCDDDLDVPTPPQGEGLAECSTKLLKLFRRKADATQGLHASVAARIGGRPISAWLTSFILEEEGEEFIRALANSRAWICPGDAEKSRLFREFSWGGRMFGVSHSDSPLSSGI
jgi:hypothetical protein